MYQLFPKLKSCHGELTLEELMHFVLVVWTWVNIILRENGKDKKLWLFWFTRSQGGGVIDLIFMGRLVIACYIFKGWTTWWWQPQFGRGTCSKHCAMVCWGKNKGRFKTKLWIETMNLVSWSGLIFLWTLNECYPFLY